jgi:hypothetical protein
MDGDGDDVEGSGGGGGNGSGGTATGRASRPSAKRAQAMFSDLSAKGRHFVEWSPEDDAGTYWL